MGLIKEDHQISDNESEEENEEVITQKPQLENTDTIKRLKTDCGAEVIIKKSRSTKKKNINPPIVIYMEDLVEQNAIPEQKVIVKQKKGKGRPKKQVPIVQYVDNDGDTVNEDDGDVSQVIINKPKKEKLSAKDLKMLELQQKIAELEAVSGKKIRGTKKLTVDKRQTKIPSEKQIAARKKFVENNKLRNEAKKKKKEEEQKLKNKESVKQVVDELAELKKQNALEKEQLKAQLQKEEEAKIEQKPVIKNPYEDLI
jgi:hypothetical protein